MAEYIDDVFMNPATIQIQILDRQMIDQVLNFELPRTQVE